MGDPTANPLIVREQNVYGGQVVSHLAEHFDALIMGMPPVSLLTRIQLSNRDRIAFIKLGAVQRVASPATATIFTPFQNGAGRNGSRLQASQSIRLPKLDHVRLDPLSS